MIIKLKEIAEITNGYAFRKKIEPSSDGTVSVVQMKDLTENNTIDLNNAIIVEDEGFKKHHILRKGDLVFRTRGQIFNSAILETEPENIVTLSGPLLKIRITEPEKILPEYINSYISLNKTQAYIMSRVKNSSLSGMITKNAVEEIEIIIPSIEKQKSIIQIDKLIRQEQILMKELIDKKERLYKHILNNYISDTHSLKGENNGR
ncbi:MAG: restriction endonuclease subunit S [Candidatus Muirbacterium halophilum]|nr:restriction endonuclease subunit S [Candidatus Muirbacterium halophilum]MCK9474812.1 restriction endonuclease subunit S [Candidatus Muirbacterium halophilum]